jgi:hypothetical protein
MNYLNCSVYRHQGEVPSVDSYLAPSFVLGMH